jgi:hypothetical protein
MVSRNLRLEFVSNKTEITLPRSLNEAGSAEVKNVENKV